MTKNSEREASSTVLEERRHMPRHVAWVPAYLEPAADGIKRLCVTHDVSNSGGLLMTHARLEPGDPVTVELFLGPDTTRPRVTAAHVVRGRFRSQRNTFWTYDTALNFDEPIDDAEGDIEEIERKQKEVWGK